MKTYLLLILSLFFAMTAWGVDNVLPNDVTTVGKKSSSAQKKIVFQNNQGVSNTQIISSPSANDFTVSSTSISLKATTTSIGSGVVSSSPQLKFNNGAVSQPTIRYNDITQEIEYASNGVVFEDITTRNNSTLVSPTITGGLSSGTTINNPTITGGTISGTSIVGGIPGVYSTFQSYSPIITGVGTPIIHVAEFREDTETIQIRVEITTGTVAATALTVTLPSGKNISSSYIAATIVGWAMSQSAGVQVNPIVSTGLGTTLIYFSRTDTGNAGVSPQNANNVVSSGNRFTFFATIRK